MDAVVRNLAPEKECVVVGVGEWIITVDKDQKHGKVWVIVEDTKEGSKTVTVLGDPSITQSG